MSFLSVLLSLSLSLSSSFSVLQFLDTLRSIVHCALKHLIYNLLIFTVWFWIIFHLWHCITFCQIIQTIHFSPVFIQSNIEKESEFDDLLFTISRIATIHISEKVFFSFSFFFSLLHLRSHIMHWKLQNDVFIKCQNRIKNENIKAIIYCLKPELAVCILYYLVYEWNQFFYRLILVEIRKRISWKQLLKRKL